MKDEIKHENHMAAMGTAVWNAARAYSPIEKDTSLNVT